MVAIRPFDGSSGSADIFALMCIDAESEADPHHVFYGAAWWKEFVRRPHGFAFVAEGEDRAVCGFVAVEHRSESEVYVAWLHVVNSWRRKGVGSALLSHVVDWAKRHAISGSLTLHVETSNAAAISLYQNSGFKMCMNVDGERQVIQDYLDDGRHSFLMHYDPVAIAPSS